MVPDAGGGDRPRALPAPARLRGLARRRPHRHRPGRARPVDGAHEPPAARARERRLEPRRLGARRRPRAAGLLGRLHARHDPRGRCQPADLDRHLPGQRRGAAGVARRAPQARRGARARAGDPRRRLARALDRRGRRQPAPTPGGGLRGSGHDPAGACARPRPAGRPLGDHAGARRGEDQHRGLRARPPLAGARRHAERPRRRRGGRAPRRRPARGAGLLGHHLPLRS